MAYDPLNVSEIAAGKPTKEEIFTKIKNNQDGFNVDIEALKQTSVIDVFDVKFGGRIDQYSQAQINTRSPVFRAPVNATIVAFKASLLTASTSGVLEIELEKSTDEGVNWSPLLLTPVQVSGLTVGSISGSVNWVDVPSQSFNQGDLLRLLITGVQVDQGEFHVSIYGEVS